MEKNSRQESSDKYEVIGSADKSDITIYCNPDLTEKEIIYYDKDDNIVEIFTFF